MNNTESLSNPGLPEEPYVGMPIHSMNGGYSTKRSSCDGVDNCPPGMAYVPWQCWGNIYDPDMAFHRGTIFPELDLPWEVR